MFNDHRFVEVLIRKRMEENAIDDAEDYSRSADARARVRTATVVNTDFSAGPASRNEHPG